MDHRTTTAETYQDYMQICLIVYVCVYMCISIYVCVYIYREGDAEAVCTSVCYDYNLNENTLDSHQSALRMAHFQCLGILGRPGTLVAEEGQRIQ